MKKRILIGVVIIIGSLLAYTTFGSTSGTIKNNDNYPIDIAKWQEKAPNLFNNVGYQGLIESNSNVVTSNNPQTEHYIGKVTNPFRVRDDVLEFIIKYFKNNESAVYAAIRIEQYDRRIYEANTDKVAVKLSNEDEIPIWCLGNIVGIIGVDKYLDELEKIRLSTLEGRIMDQDARGKLGWKILGNHMTAQQMDLICNKGDY